MSSSIGFDPSFKVPQENPSIKIAHNPLELSDFLGKVFAFLTAREAQEVRTVSKKFNKAALIKVEQRTLAPLRGVGLFIVNQLDPFKYAIQIKTLNDILSIQTHMLVAQIKTNAQKLHSEIENILEVVEKNDLMRLKSEASRLSECVKNSIRAYCNVELFRKKFDKEKFCTILVQTGNTAKALQILEQLNPSFLKRIDETQLFKFLFGRLFRSGQLELAVRVLVMTGASRHNADCYSSFIDNCKIGSVFEHWIKLLPSNIKISCVHNLVSNHLRAGMTFSALEIILQNPFIHDFDFLLTQIVDIYFERGDIVKAETYALHIKEPSKVFKNLSFAFLLLEQIEKAENYACKIFDRNLRMDAFKMVVYWHTFKENWDKLTEFCTKNLQYVPTEFRNKFQALVASRNHAVFDFKPVRSLFEAVILRGDEAWLIHMLNDYDLWLVDSVIIKAFFIRGDQKQLIPLARQISNPTKKEQFITRVFEFWCKVEDFKQAEETIQELDVIKESALKNLFFIKLWRGEIKSLPLDTPQEHLIHFIEALIMEGKSIEALNYLGRVTDTPKQINLYMELFYAHLLKGQISLAQIILNRLPEGRTKKKAQNILLANTQTYTWL